MLDPGGHGGRGEGAELAGGVAEHGADALERRAGGGRVGEVEPDRRDVVGHLQRPRVAAGRAHVDARGPQAGDDVGADGAAGAGDEDGAGHAETSGSRCAARS